MVIYAYLFLENVLAGRRNKICMLYEKTGAIVLAKDLTKDKTHTN